MDSLNCAIDYALQNNRISALKPEQKAVIEHYISGRDVLFCSPTGSGKSLIFQMAPFLYQYLENKEKCCTCAVVSPLAALMKSQVQELKHKNIKALYFTDSESTDSAHSDITNISDGNYELILASPETLLGRKRDVLLNLSENGYLKALFFDEAHCIKKIGKAGPGKNALAYRPMYGALGELRSLAGPKIPVIALTATASNHVRNMIKNDLCMNEDIFELAINPNKTNIKFWVIETKRSRGDITKDFDWLVDLIRKEGVNTPRMIIFFRKIDHIADVYEHLETSLGKRRFLNYEKNKINDDRNRLFDMFHLKTDDEVKESITNSYQDPTGHTRVVLCSTSFSMGLNVKGVDTVIHYGACNDLDDILQETGRAGRHADDKCHSIVMKYKQCLSSKNITQNIKDFVNATTCRRNLLLEPFTDETIVEEGHNCCDICAVNCACLCLCNEGNTCDCGVKCPSNTSKVYDRITQFIENEMNIDDEDSNSEGFDTDSDIDEHINRKPCVVDYSSDYE